MNTQTSLLSSEKSLALLTVEKTVSPRNDPVTPVIVQNRDPEKEDQVKEEMAVGADSTALVEGNLGTGQEGPRLGCRVGGCVWSSIVTGWNLSWVGGTEPWSQPRTRVYGKPGICQE